MKNFTHYIAFALLAVAAAASPSCTKPAAHRELPTYRIGYMICNSEQETLERFRPLTALLSERLGVHFEALAIDTMNFPKQIDTLHFTHTNSLLYIMMSRHNGVDILAVEKRGELGARSKGLVVSRKKSGIKTINDLRGKTMLFGPMLAPTAFMSQVYALQQKGFDIDEDLASYHFPTGPYKHEKLIYAVNFGRYDAGAFPYYDFEIMARQGKVNREDFNILAEGPLIPYCNFGVTQQVDEALAESFKQILLSITKEDTVEIDGERVKVLSRAQLDGFQAATDTDFDIVRSMAKATNMPPYQEY